MGKELFHSGSCDERRWDDSVIDKVLLSLCVLGVTLALGVMGYHIYQRSVESHHCLHTFQR